MGLDALFVLLGEEEPYSEAVRELMKWEHEKEADFNASADKPWKSSARDIEEVVNGIVQTMRNYETSVTDQCSDTISRSFNLGAFKFEASIKRTGVLQMSVDRSQILNLLKKLKTRV